MVSGVIGNNYINPCTIHFFVIFARVLKKTNKPPNFNRYVLDT
jgi:hypothetical protein